MSNAIELLEEIGQNARLRGASNEELRLALDRLNIDPVISSAVLNNDQDVLETVLGANTSACCVQFPSDDEESDTQPDEVPADDETEAIAVDL